MSNIENGLSQLQTEFTAKVNLAKIRIQEITKEGNIQIRKEDIEALWEEQQVAKLKYSGDKKDFLSAGKKSAYVAILDRIAGVSGYFRYESAHSDEILSPGQIAVSLVAYESLIQVKRKFAATGSINLPVFDFNRPEYIEGQIQAYKDYFNRIGLSELINLFLII